MHYYQNGSMNMVFNFGKYVSLPFFLILFLLSSCSNVLVQENSGDIEVSLVVPEDSGRLASQRSVNATIILTHHVEGWIENQQGERLQTVNQDFSGSTVLSFKQVEPETVVRVFVRISDKSGVLYSGKSDFFTVERRGNQVSVELDKGDFPTGDESSEEEMPATDTTTEDVSPEGTTTEDASPEDTETAGVNEPVADEGNSPAASAFDPSWITVTVVSRNHSTPNTVTASGSSNGTSVTHNFYGVKGSQVQFSLSQEASAIDKDMKLNIYRNGAHQGNKSTFTFDQESETVKYEVRIERSSGETSSWYYFNVTSEMKSVTVTFTGVDYNYASKSNETPNINIYNGFTVGGKVATTDYMNFTTGFGGNEIVSLYSGLNYAVTTSSTTWTTEVGVDASSSIKFEDGTKSEGWKQTYTLSDLWGKSSIEWGTYFRLNYTISQP